MAEPSELPGPGGTERLGMDITFGDVTIPMTPYNTLVRRFGLDNGAYDNCIVVEGDNLVEFKLTPELTQDLESRGAPTTLRAIPDKAALSYYTQSLFDSLWQEGLK